VNPKVAIVEFDGDIKRSLRKAVKLIGGLGDLNVADRAVVIKVGVFDHRAETHSTVDVVEAIISIFDRAPKVFIAESDNYRGKGSERLQIWKGLFSDRVVPFSLSEDEETRPVKVADETLGLSHILFKPNVFVSTHILRIFDKGSILKNLLGLVPDGKKVRFHKKLETALIDMYEAVGGIDLAVADGTYVYRKTESVPRSELDDPSYRIRTDVLLVGRDAVAVEAVGATLVGMDPSSVPVIREAVSRGLGEGSLDKIEVVGASMDGLRERVQQQLSGEKTG